MKELIKSYGRWLDIMGYAQATTRALPSLIKEFWYYLKQQGLQDIRQLESKHLKAYQIHLKTRSHKHTGGALSSSYINHHLWAIDTFFTYLHHKGINTLPDLKLQHLKLDPTSRDILTQAEIKSLYELAANQEAITLKQSALNQLDLLILTVYYACGLRRNEGVQIEVSDVNLDTNILHVRKGKGGKERLIPFNKTAHYYFSAWIHEHRLVLLKDKRMSNLFIGSIGTALTGGSLNRRFKKLVNDSENQTLKDKILSLHSLRHSIATHLLNNGMEIQQVQQFLGHRSLSSTEIYTHLENEK